MARTSRYYSERTLKILFGQASHCAYPGCTQPLILSDVGAADEAVLARICHIIAASDDGPRGDPEMDSKARNGPDNLLLMCPTHGVVVDVQHEAYPAPLLRSWKLRQQRETASNLGPYRASIARYLSGELEAGAMFQRRTAVAPVEPRLETLKRDRVVAQNLTEVTTRLDLPLVAVVGGSGSGKTTLLHQVALSAVDRSMPATIGDRNGALPLIVNCSRFTGSLLPLIATETRNATGITIDLDGMQGLDFPLNLYCDDFQYCADKKALVEQLRAFTHQHKGARCALFTHELPDYAVLERFGVVAYRIADLNDDGLLGLFEGFMDEEAAEALLDDLAARGEIEAIRQPVLAALVAVAHADLPFDAASRPTPLRRGELFRRVIRDGVLTQWVAIRSPDLASPQAQLAADTFADFAAALVRADKEFLPETELAESGSGNVQQSISIGISCGLLRRHDQEIGFAHAAIRDYFAAEWLLDTAPRRIVDAWFTTRWHGALKNFASLWPPDRRRLFWLRLSGWLSLRLISVLRVAPQSFATRLFYLMLEFAAESRIDERWLQLGIFNRYRRGQTFLDESAVNTSRLFISGWEDKFAHVYRLFGQLRHPEIDHWLRTTTERRRYTIHGIRQDTSEAGLETLVRGLGSDDDGLADDIAVELAFEYPRAMLRRVFDRLLADPEVRIPVMLWRVSKACQRRRTYPRDAGSPHAGRRNRIGAVLSTDGYWRDRMVGLLLQEEDEKIADSATSMLRCLHQHGWLRDDVEAILVETLQRGSELARRRAARILVYGRGEASLAMLLRALQEDSDVVVGVRACASLLYRDTSHAPKHYLTVLRRFGDLDAAGWQAKKASIAHTVRAYVAEKDYKPYKKYVRAFLAYLQCGDGAFERIIAADGLNRIRGRVIAEAMHGALEIESEESVRNHLAELWGTNLDVTVDEAIRYLLTSPRQGFSSLAADMVRRRQDEPSAEVVDLIRVSAAREEDAQARYDLGRALDYLEIRDELRQRPQSDEEVVLK
jgi:hypothetical protein